MGSTVLYYYTQYIVVASGVASGLHVVRAEFRQRLDTVRSLARQGIHACGGVFSTVEQLRVDNIN